MKLRLRSLESKETLKIEVPDSCSFQQLKDTISQTISASSSSSSSVHLSLNRKDEIQASSPDDLLHSLGVTAGDLVFYSLNPTAFSLETLPHKPETASRDGPTIQDSPGTLAGDSTVEKTPTLDPAEPETVDMTDGSDEVVVVSTNSEPSFVKRVLKELVGNNVNDFKLLVSAVHAVVLESGFVRVDHDSGMAVGFSHLLDDSPISSAVSLWYTLPEILTSGASHIVNLKFQTLGYFVNVCGSLVDDVGSRLHCVCLDKRKYARPLELMLANCESKGSGNDGGEEDILFGSEVFEMWKMVKDRLVLPLLIDLCEKAGLDLPPCFMRLPMELKLLILERVPGVDVAKVACTCSELRYLSTNNDLWKKKYEEEFGKREESIRWLYKDWFAVAWESQKRILRRSTIRMNQHPHTRFRMPPIWGGGYGVQPVTGIAFPRYPKRGFVIPDCLRGFNQ